MILKIIPFGFQWGAIQAASDRGANTIGSPMILVIAALGDLRLVKFKRGYLIKDQVVIPHTRIALTLLPILEIPAP